MCESRNAPVLTQRWWWGSGWRDNWQQRKEDNQPSAACLSSFKTDDKLKATRSLLIEYEDVVEVQIERQSVGGHERAVRSVSRTFIWFFFLFRGKKSTLCPPADELQMWRYEAVWPFEIHQITIKSCGLNYELHNHEKGLKTNCFYVLCLFYLFVRTAFSLSTSKWSF